MTWDMRAAEQAAREGRPYPRPESKSPAKAIVKAGGPVAEQSEASTFGRRSPEPKDLTTAFRSAGLSESAAKVAARGRARLHEAVKNVAGLSARCFAWVGDPEDPDTWKMQIARTDDAGSDWAPEEDLVRAAVAQLPGNAGYNQGADIPAGELPKVKSILYAAWNQCNLPLDDPLASVLTQEALARAFRALGVRDVETAARGRSRRR